MPGLDRSQEAFAKKLEPIPLHNSASSGKRFDCPGLLVGFDGARPQPADAGNGVVGAHAACNQMAGEDDASAAETGGAMDGDAHSFFQCPLDAGNAALELLLGRCFHVLYRLMNDEETRVVYPVAAERVLRE